MAEEFLRMAQVRRVVLFRFVGRSGLLGVLVLLCILAAVISPGWRNRGRGFVEPWFRASSLVRF
jgi:hypothetical protein